MAQSGHMIGCGGRISSSLCRPSKGVVVFQSCPISLIHIWRFSKSKAAHGRFLALKLVNRPDADARRAFTCALKGATTIMSDWRMGRVAPSFSVQAPDNRSRAAA